MSFSQIKFKVGGTISAGQVRGTWELDEFRNQYLTAQAAPTLGLSVLSILATSSYGHNYAGTISEKTIICRSAGFWHTYINTWETEKCFGEASTITGTAHTFSIMAKHANLGSFTAHPRIKVSWYEVSPAGDTLLKAANLGELTTSYATYSDTLQVGSFSLGTYSRFKIKVSAGYFDEAPD